MLKIKTILKLFGVMLGVMILISLPHCSKTLNSSSDKVFSKIDSLYYKGKAQLALKNSESAADFYNQALILAEKHDSQDLEFIRLTGLINMELANVYFKHTLFDDALQKQAQALAIFSSIADSSNMMLSSRYMGRILAQKTQYDEAESYYNQALVIAQAINRPEIAHSVYLEIGRDCYINKGETEKAIEYIRYSLNLRSNDADNERDNDINIANMLLGILYYYSDKPDDAVKHLTEALKSDKATIRMSAYQTLSAIATERGDYQKALEYHDSFVENMILTDNEMRAENILRVKNDYQLQVQKEEILLNERLSRFRLIIIVLALLSAALLTILLLSRKNAKNKLEAQRLRYQTERNQNRIRELVQQMDNLVQQNAELQNENKTSPQREDKIISDWETTNRILQLSNKLKENITVETMDFHLDENDWNNFIRLTDWMYDNFTSRLKERYPKLTQWDLRICCLVKHQIPNYVISLLLDMQTTSYYRRKIRIKQNKMNVLDDTRSFEEIINEQ